MPLPVSLPVHLFHGPGDLLDNIFHFFVHQRTLFRKLAHFLGHYRKAGPLLSCTGCFNTGVQGKDLLLALQTLQFSRFLGDLYLL